MPLIMTWQEYAQILHMWQGMSIERAVQIATKCYEKQYKEQVDEKSIDEFYKRNPITCR